jgi:hypothetical protein
MTTTTNFTPQVGSFVQYTMVTDTVVYEVVKVTAKTITVRPTIDGPRTWRCELVDHNDYPVIRTEQVVDETQPVKVLRRRQDGTYRLCDSASPLRPPYMVEGVPVRKTDYRF